MKLVSCSGANRYSVIGSVIFEDGSNTGVCPICQVRVPLDLDGIVLAHGAGIVAGWQTGRPPEHGYYLAAWRCGDSWRVSELWFNPDSIGSGWWSSRGYLGERTPGSETLPVEAWMPMPAYASPEVSPV